MGFPPIVWKKDDFNAMTHAVEVVDNNKIHFF